MPSLDNLTPDGKFFGLFLGSSGTGKKSAVASFPKPIKFLDFDQRIRGLYGCPWLLDEMGTKLLPGMGDVEIFPSKPRQDDYIFSRVNTVLEQIQGQVNIGLCPYKTLYVGSITGAAFAFLQDANLLTHQGGKGNKLGPLNMTGPQDYKFEANAARQMLAFLQFLREHPTGIPNIIVGGHVVPRWGKPGMEEDDLNKDKVEKINENFKYSENIVVGEKLLLTDKLAEEVPGKFEHIFKFSKEMVLGNSAPQHFVEFRGEIARTTFAKLPNGRVNITGRPFYEGLMRLAGFEIKE